VWRGRPRPRPCPPFFRSFGIKDLGGGSCQVFGFKGLAGKVFKNQWLNLSKSAENWFGAASRAVLVDGVETAPIRSLSSRATGLMSMDFEHGLGVVKGGLFRLTEARHGGRVGIEHY
jgi:hypothetical protein